LVSFVDAALAFSWIRVGQRMVYDLAGDLFARLQRRSLRCYGRSSVGDSLMRVTGDSWCLQTVVDVLLYKPANALVGLVGTVAVMAAMDPRLTAAALVVAPLMVGASFGLGKRIRSAAKAGREVESRLQSHVQQTLGGIPVVQAFAQEEREHRRFRQFADAAIRTRLQASLLRNVSGLAAGLIGTLGAGAVLWLGAQRVLDGQLTVGSLLVFVAYLGPLQAGLTTFANIYPTLQSAGARVDRVLEVLEAAPEVRDRPGAAPLPPVRGGLRLEGVTFGYEPGRPVLRGVSLAARPGETVALVGPSGAGKSTLAGLVPRFFDPWQGRVTLDGRDLRAVQLRSLRAQVAVVLQEPFLFPLTVAENIAYGRPGAARGEVAAAAAAAGADAFIRRLPRGYDTVVGERGATLSGGERQRLAIARALLKDAPVLVLDEPTAALDAATEAALLEALARLMRGRTTLVIAHRLSTIRAADRIVVLEAGRVVEAGAHAELVAAGGPYARLHALQAGAAGAPRPAGVVS
jgi:ATP-binding cassette subfamily B protein